MHAHPARPGRVAAGFAAALAALLLVTGCSSVKSLVGGGGPGGLPADEASRVSLVVAQTRAQFADLSGTAIPFEPRTLPDDAAGSVPEPALRGSGTGVQPGLQLDTPERIEAALYLDKQRYARGYLEVTRSGAPPERWPIVAYDQRGKPRETFDFTYVLATPTDELRYLVVIGGRYDEGGEAYLGYEGTLIVPGPGNDLEAWQKAYKLDFGYRFPVVPAHQRKVKQAQALFGELQRDVARLDRLRDGIAASEGELAALQGTAPPAAQAARHDQAIAEEQARRDSLQVQRDALIETTEAKLVRYYGLRKALSDEFAAFTQSNRWRWLDQAGKQAFYDDWKVVELHHPRIDQLVSAFIAHKRDAGKVLEARRAAMDTIARNDNWNRDPSRAGTQQGAPQAGSTTPSAAPAPAAAKGTEAAPAPSAGARPAAGGSSSQ